MHPLPMNSTTRQQALDAMAGTTPENPLDVLVIGGGVVGAAAAFDASTRGLQVGLVEARDLAQGTSSRSSKLVHGGLRYLQMLDFKLVAEALRERNLLMTRTAPHLVKGLPFVFPFEHRVADRAFIGSGVTLYDGLSTAASALGNGLKSVFSSAGRAPLHRHMSRKGLQKRFPGLDGEKFVGALEYFDAQVDDARLVMTLARSAASLGAHVAVRTEVTEYLRSGRDGEEIVGVVVRDRETGAEHRVYARETIMAAGVWTGDQEKLAHAEAQDGTGPALKVLASKGIHITVPKDRIPAQGHVGVITQTDKSVLFIIPMGEYWSVGTTDTAWHEAVDVPAPNASDIDYVLEHANAVLETDLTHDDVIGTWAGLRPLLQPVDADEASSSKVSREHTVMRMAPGLSAVAGGKLTTYRSMAQDAVDFAIAEHYRDRASLTEHLPLLGAQGYGEWAERVDDIAAGYNLAPKTVQRLLGRYGSLLSEVLELIDQRPELGEPVPGAAGYLGAEYVYAARCEGAVHLEDLLERRTRLFHEVRDRGLEASEHVAALVAAEIGWDEAQTEYELRAYASYVEAHRAAECAATDAEAAELMRAVLPAQQVLETS